MGCASRNEKGPHDNPKEKERETTEREEKKESSTEIRIIMRSQIVKPIKETGGKKEHKTPSNEGSFHERENQRPLNVQGRIQGREIGLGCSNNIDERCIIDTRQKRASSHTTLLEDPGIGYYTATQRVDRKCQGEVEDGEAIGERHC